MSCERDIRFDLIARLCPNTTGAELRSVATEVSYTLVLRLRLPLHTRPLRRLLSILDPCLTSLVNAVVFLPHQHTLIGILH